MILIYKSFQFKIDKITQNGCYYKNKKVIDFNKDNKLLYYCSYHFISYFINKTDILYLDILDIFTEPMFKVDIYKNYLLSIIDNIFITLKSIYTYEKVIEIFENISIDFVYSNNNNYIINFLYFYKYIDIFIPPLDLYYKDMINSTNENFNNFKENFKITKYKNKYLLM